MDQRDQTSKTGNQGIPPVDRPLIIEFVESGPTCAIAEAESDRPNSAVGTGDLP